jgi:rare lipoprotein A
MVMRSEVTLRRTRAGAVWKAPAAAIVLPAVIACTTTPPPPVIVEEPPIATGGGTYKVGDPYEIAGVWYYPREDPEYDQTGIGSWYGEEFHGRLTANGEIFDRNQITAAHPTLPMPVNARVTNLENGRSIVVRINDRGPFANGRVIDLSEKAAELLGYRVQGTARVRVTYLGRADLEGNRTLLAGADTPEEIATAVPAAPTGVVASGSLAPVAGAAIAAERPVDTLPRPVAQQSQTSSDLPSVDGEVTQVPVPQATGIYIQAGAFGNFENANRVASNLAFAGARISQIEREGMPLYRVRMGPYQDVTTADAVLFEVQSSGHMDAQFVIE